MFQSDDAASPVPGGDARSIARRLALLPERRMRSARLREIVVALDPEQAAWLLDSLATAGRAGGPPFDLSLLAAVDMVAQDELPYAARRAIYEAAEALKLQACRELLMSREDSEENDAAKPRALIPGGRPLTLGERKSLARSWRRDVLERLLLDPHADVIALLLINPHVTESDILKIATSRRSSSNVLELVLASTRWGINPRVRKALVRNPQLPLSTALRLLGLLNRTDLRELAQDPALPSPMHAALLRRLRPVS